MASKKLRSFLLAVAMGLAMVLISTSLLETSPALARERAGTEPVRLDPPAQAPPPEDFLFIVVFTDDLSIITYLSGNVIGEGEHGGEVKCNGDNCSKKTQLTVPYGSVEYKFTTRQALDPEEDRVVVAGSGKISSLGQKERFLFTATFEDNRDGTVRVTYVASRSDASFIIPRAPGTFSISSRR
jgi:hypothetical protein